MEQKKGQLRTDKELIDEFTWAMMQESDMLHGRIYSPAELEWQETRYLELETHAAALEDEYKKRFIIPQLKNPTQKNIDESFLNRSFVFPAPLVDLTDEQRAELEAREKESLQSMRDKMLTL